MEPVKSGLISGATFQGCVCTIVQDCTRKHNLGLFGQWPEYRGGHISGVLIRGSSLHNKNKQALHAAQIPLRLVVASSAIVLLVLHSTIITEYSYQGRMDPLGRRPIQPVNAVSDGKGGCQNSLLVALLGLLESQVC